MFGNSRSTALSDNGLYIGRSIFGYAITSLKSSPICETTQSGREIDERPRRKMVTRGLTAAVIVLVTAVRSSGRGGATARTASREMASRLNASASADLNRVATRLSLPPRTGTNEEPGSLSTKFELVGIALMLAAVWPASDTASAAVAFTDHCRNKRDPYTPAATIAAAATTDPAPRPKVRTSTSASTSAITSSAVGSQGNAFRASSTNGGAPFGAATCAA